MDAQARRRKRREAKQAAPKTLSGQADADAKESRPAKSRSLI
jgi:hypothetical protein